MITALIALSIYTAPCQQFDVCQYQPGYNGPLMPTWNTPGGGYSGNPVQCDPVTYQCHQVVTP